jgi:ABC-type proline/glycine betaine transport system permease subunit
MDIVMIVKGALPVSLLALLLNSLFSLSDRREFRSK